MSTDQKRSQFLKIVFASAILLAASAARAQVLDVVHNVKSTPPASAATQDHRLVLYNTHTAERLEIVYRRGDQFVPAALAKLDYFLRDHNTNEVRPFDPRLYDILSD